VTPAPWFDEHTKIRPSDLLKTFDPTPILHRFGDVVFADGLDALAV
jgi:hypothetical protein